MRETSTLEIFNFKIRVQIIFVFTNIANLLYLMMLIFLAIVDFPRNTICKVRFKCQILILAFKTFHQTSFTLNCATFKIIQFIVTNKAMDIAKFQFWETNIFFRRNGEIFATFQTLCLSGVVKMRDTIIDFIFDHLTFVILKHQQFAFGIDILAFFTLNLFIYQSFIILFTV